LIFLAGTTFLTLETEAAENQSEKVGKYHYQVNQHMAREVSVNFTQETTQSYLHIGGWDV
jgi:hypothetical protein